MNCLGLFLWLCVAEDYLNFSFMVILNKYENTDLFFCGIFGANLMLVRYVKIIQ